MENAQTILDNIFKDKRLETGNITYGAPLGKSDHAGFEYEYTINKGTTKGIKEEPECEEVIKGKNFMELNKFLRNIN